MVGFFLRFMNWSSTGTKKDFVPFKCSCFNLLDQHKAQLLADFFPQSTITCRNRPNCVPKYQVFNWTPHVTAKDPSNYKKMARIIEGDSVARGPKLLSIKNYVIEITTWKFIYTYRERYKTGPAHNRCWNWSPFTSKHTWMRFSKFWNTFLKFVWGF